MFRIAISAIGEGVHPLDRTPSAEEIEVDPELFSDIRVVGQLDYRSRRVLVSFEVSALARLECDRTLVPFTQRVYGAFTVLFAPPALTDGQEELKEDVRVLQPSDQEIDLTDAVRDTLLLALPVRRVAPEAEHLDLPLRFGTAGEDGVDPRWDALRKLRSDSGPDPGP